MKKSILLLALALAGAPLDGQIIINEIHYSPQSRTSPEEFVELYNNSDRAVDISGWYFSDGIDYVFPPLTSIGARDYLVVAENVAHLRGLHGNIPIVGPYSGRLDNAGEELILRRPDGLREDAVNYASGFPWPIVGGRGSPNYSIELIHPDLDNDLGGSWRPSNPGSNQSNAIVSAGAVWRYRKGTSEASSPVTAWREVGFDDSSWTPGRTSLGYGDEDDATVLQDMQGGYTSVYLRHEFTLEDPLPASLTLRLYVDDGAIVWINGTEVERAYVGSGQIPFNAEANSHEADWDTVTLTNATAFLRTGTNVIAIHALNTAISSSDFSIDAELSRGSSSGSGPTPAAQNTVFGTSVAPHMRQVEHFPEQPKSNEAVIVSVKVTDDDGVESVSLDYQLVDPGQYIRLRDPEYQTDWTTVAMNDAGTNGDQFEGDDIYSVAMSPNLQVHRRLVRYRITVRDRNGSSATAPYPEDTQPNFAYFVYDGVPPWRGAVRPGSTSPVTYSGDLLGSIPTYHLLTVRQDHLDAMSVPYRWGRPDQQVPSRGSYGGSDYLWQGTLVYDGEVYDHIRFRARGGVWRYSMGKNMWKFDFNRGHYFEARDEYGKRYRSGWDKVNFSALIQQGNFGQRGEQGLFEAVGFDLHNRSGNAAPESHYVHFRIIEDEDEDGPDQYSGDFRGLYLAIEQMDGRFLDEHGLPDGNLYKMEGGTGDLNNQGPTQPTNKSDLNLFMNTYRNQSPTIDWWRENLDLDDYYNFRAIASAIHDYDIHAGKNYFYFNNPETGMWQVFNWDLDLTWTTTYGGGGERGPLNQYVLDLHPELMKEHRNRVRELLDLLFNPEQVGIMLDEIAGVVYRPGQPSFVDADRAMWDYNPILVSSYVNSSKAAHGRYYEATAARTFSAMIQHVKNYVSARQSHMNSIARDTAIPRRPTITSIGPPGFPIDALSFRSSAFSDPQGDSTFGAMKWRVAEITPAGAPAFDPLNPKRYEIRASWESPVLTSFQSDITLPSGALKIGHRYRARVRMMDSTNRWSNWSQPVDFVTGEPTTPFPQVDALRITEIMYHPLEGFDYEFIELQNIGSEPIDLTPVSISDGVEFDFASSDVKTLFPGEFVLVVENAAVFASKYNTTNMTIAGEYRGRLSNGGEQIVLTTGGNSTILDFFYLDVWYPLTDGGGYSLTIVDSLAPAETWSDQLNWTVSSVPGGTPGRGDETGGDGLQRPGDSNQDGLLDIGDAVSLLLHLYAGGRPLPCDADSINEGGNRILLDLNGDALVDSSDAIYLLEYLFRDGEAPIPGTFCVRIEGCPNACLR